jgi:16S rRNA (cytidine1402-2'-O)-methyltransferase
VENSALAVHEQWMQQALALAAEAEEAGEVPVGCVIVHNNQVIGKGCNTSMRHNNVVSHAELHAIAQASEHLGTAVLSNCTLYVTLEPCLMCSGAIVAARIPMVVFGASEPKTGAAHSVHDVLDHPRNAHRVTVRSGILANESAQLLQSAFAVIREKKSSHIARPQPPASKTGTLFVVPVPVGNLDDMTLRAVKTLRATSVVLCEDTRVTSALLRHYGIADKTLVSYHNFNERARIQQCIERLQQGTNIALVSDAGTPGISDPGYRIVHECASHAIPVVALPGATAFVPAVAASGLPTTTILFAGFLPTKGSDRLQRLQQVLAFPATTVLYETAHRIPLLIENLMHLGMQSRAMVIAREISKLHEEYIRGSVQDLYDTLLSRTLRGECVVMIDHRQ